MSEGAKAEDNDDANPGEEDLIHRLLAFGVEFGEFFGFLVEGGKVFFGDFFLVAGFNEVAKNADKDEWTDEGRVEDGPHDDAYDARADESEGSDVGEKCWNFGGAVGCDFGDGLAERTHGIREGLENEVGDTEENTTDDEKGDKADAEDATEVFDESFAMFEKDSCAL